MSGHARQGVATDMVTVCLVDGEATGWAVSGSFFQDVRKTKNGSFIRPELGTGSIHHGTFPGSPNVSYGVSVK